MGAVEAGGLRLLEPVCLCGVGCVRVSLGAWYEPGRGERGGEAKGENVEGSVGVTARTAYLSDLVDDLHGVVLVVAMVLDGGPCAGRVVVWCGERRGGGFDAGTLVGLAVCCLLPVCVGEWKTEGISQSDATSVCQALYRSGVLAVVVCLV